MLPLLRLDSRASRTHWAAPPVSPASWSVMPKKGQREAEAVPVAMATEQANALLVQPPGLVEVSLRHGHEGQASNTSTTRYDPAGSELAPHPVFPGQDGALARSRWRTASLVRTEPDVHPRLPADAVGGPLPDGGHRSAVIGDRERGSDTRGRHIGWLG